MKHRYIFVLTCSLFQRLPALSQTYKVSNLTPVYSTEISWNSEEVDVGYPQRNTEMRARFRFTNTGSADLHIDKVSSANGDMQITFPRQTIPPGGEGEVVVSYKPTRKGNFTYHIMVTYNNPEPAILKVHGIAY